VLTIHSPAALGSGPVALRSHRGDGKGLRSLVYVMRDDSQFLFADDRIEVATSGSAEV